MHIQLTTPNALRTEIQKFVRAIADKFRPERIILFGSHAYGDPTGDSDVDILVVMPHKGEAWMKAAEITSAIEREFALDLIVRDPQYLQYRIDQHDWFLKEIVECGEVLYAASD